MRKKSRQWFFPVFFFVLIISSAAIGQNTNSTKTDSLLKEINKKTGAEKISAQLEIALQNVNSNKEIAKQLAGAALIASKNSGDKNLEMRSLYTIGRIYTELENNEVSLTYLDSALHISEVIENNWYKGEILFRIGVNEHRLGEHLQALESFNASILACRLSDNFKIAGSSYSMMGDCFQNEWIVR